MNLCGLMFELKITSKRLDAMVNIQECNVSFEIRRAMEMCVSTHERVCVMRINIMHEWTIVVHARIRWKTLNNVYHVYVYTYINTCS